MPFFCTGAVRGGLGSTPPSAPLWKVEIELAIGIVSSGYMHWAAGKRRQAPTALTADGGLPWRRKTL